jgi:hypothetical protein
LLEHVVHAGDILLYGDASESAATQYVSQVNGNDNDDTAPKTHGVVARGQTGGFNAADRRGIEHIGIATVTIDRGRGRLQGEGVLIGGGGSLARGLYRSTVSLSLRLANARQEGGDSIPSWAWRDGVI